MNISDIDPNSPITIGIMKDSYVSLNTSKLLREIDFQVYVSKSVTVYHDDNEHETDGKTGPFGWECGELEYGDSFIVNGSSDYSNDSYTTYPTPTQSVLQAWLREIHGIRVWVIPNPISSRPNDWVYNITMYEKGKLIVDLDEQGDFGLHFEEALEQGLQYGLNLINKHNG